MHKKGMKSLGAILVALTLLVSMAGCATKKLDQHPGQTETTAQVPETTEVQTTETKATEPEATEAETTAPAQASETTETPASAEAPKGEEAQNSSGENEQTPDVPDNKEPETEQETPTSAPEVQEPAEPAETEPVEEVRTCYLSISCQTILNNMGDLKEGKEVLVPSDGMILYRTAVEFQPGESVYDILSRVTMNYGIHMSSRFVPMYNSAYIEGVGNLYEFDCGEGSGWMYCVNGWFPNYGVSRYTPENGDEIQIIYTCDLGRDIGGTLVR